MSRAEHQIRELLGPLDPMWDERSAAPPRLDVVRFADGGELTDSVQRVPSAGRGRSLLAVAAVVVLVTCGVVWNALGPSAPQGLAETPLPLTIIPVGDARPASTMLEEIAARAEGSGIPARTAGPIDFLTIASWSLNSQAGDGSTISVTDSAVTETWVRPDGSGRKVTRTMPTRFQQEADREKWASSSTGKEEADYGPGRLRHYWPDRPPTDLAALRTGLAGNRPVAEMGPVAYLDGIGDLLRERVLLPGERAAVLRVLAGLPGIRHDGQTRDRAGRSGEAFSLDSAGHGLPARYILVIDPANGVVLASEEMLTTDPGLLNVRVPAVISYETYLITEFQARP